MFNLYKFLINCYTFWSGPNFKNENQARVQVRMRFKKSKIDAGEAAGAVQKIRFGAGAGAVAVKKKWAGAIAGAVNS